VSAAPFSHLDRTDQLLLVDRGMSWLTSHLDALSDADFDGDSLLPGWQRRHVVAHLGYNADGLARLADWALTGVETPMYPSAQARTEEIEVGAHASPAELRSFVATSAAYLADKWRSFGESGWHATVRTVAGDAVPAAATVWMRTKELWIHTVDLATGATFGEFPDEVLAQLLVDMPDSGVTGPPAGVARWATGRGANELDVDPGFAPPPWM
jgi:maleylpyruvate isomerase